MKIVFIHGINNQKHHLRDVLTNWTSQIHRGAAMAGVKLPHISVVTVGYYAQRLYYATDKMVVDFGSLNDELPQFDRTKTFQMGMGGTIADGSYGDALIREYMQLANVEAPEREGEIEMGVWQGLTWLIDKAQDLLPPKWSKTVSRPFLKQAAVWANNRGLRNGIENQVANIIMGETDAHKPAAGFGDEPMVIISHSLGTAIAFRMLLNEELMKGTPIPLFITLGSPLPVKFIRMSLDQQELWRPENIGEWLNLYDKDDFVPVGSPIKKGDVGFDGVKNIEGVKLEHGEDAHAIGAHLRHPEISKALASVL
ncbi:hypothetical protein IQ260_22080 [Leptolyngbya cf. ectocarpi LEGE 11479]|uniref:Alpha/beta hydrolase n=1 Tax=Leptolyngbya cf. ectocarpi LEGE 11479 TaxID=1828722 RepID=A0A929F9F3_LEPEC|nr:hypothetical protein [Leptolyngbya ectocarpi]MBE9069336.1 hypothetical protein [Leptolyngbya cf. ectocarpi LEGE 11479]